MNFLWPRCLWLMLALPLLPVLYLWLLQRRTAALRGLRLEVLRPASKQPWLRHAPPALLFVACAVLVFTVSRPTTRLALPWAGSTVMLAMDVSRSMRVSDVKPTRLEAAQDAAKTFVRDLPANVEVGLVTFAASAQVVLPATLDRTALVSAIDAFQMQLGTAVGSSIVLCLAELFPDHGIDLEDMTLGPRKRARAIDRAPASQPPSFAPVPPGSYDAAAIILLSDGRRTTGVDTLKAAQMAADRGVRIYVIGLGTVSGDAATPEGMAIYMQLDEPTLRTVAQMTGGEYHHAGTAEDLRSVYRNLGTRLQVRTRETELTALLAALAAALTLAAGSMSLFLSGRIV